MRKSFYYIGMILLSSTFVLGQGTAKKGATPDNPEAVKASPAYAELLLLKTELGSEVESLLVEYTEEYPKIKESRYKLSLVQKDLDRILAVKSVDAGKLTQALGRLMARRIEVDTDLWELRIKYNDEHPDIKRAKRKLEIFDAAVKEILG